MKLIFNKNVNKKSVQKMGRSSAPLLLVLSFVLIVFSSLTLTGCESAKPTKADRDEVRAVMEMRQKAIQTKDIDLYKQAFLPTYSDGGVSFDTLIEVMQTNFDNNAAIEFTFRRSMVDMTMNSARMVGDITYNVKGWEKPIYDQERTIFRRVDGVWKISGGVKVVAF